MAQAPCCALGTALSETHSQTLRLQGHQPPTMPHAIPYQSQQSSESHFPLVITPLAAYSIDD